MSDSLKDYAERIDRLLNGIDAYSPSRLFDLYRTAPESERDVVVLAIIGRLLLEVKRSEFARTSRSTADAPEAGA